MRGRTKSTEQSTGAVLGMRKVMSIAVTAALTASAVIFQPAGTVKAAYDTSEDKSNHWEIHDGKSYWYEKGVKQGTTGRGKEIYDKESDGWYWLDAVQGGAKATGKDAYLDSGAGVYADEPDGTGKWVRYDENGRMAKGWAEKDGKTYYFDPWSGAMAKGTVILEEGGKKTAHEFDLTTGQKTGEKEVSDDFKLFGWNNIDGEDYWFEQGVKQGVFGRGKEIYDPDSDAWYWLDSVDGGKKATGKDVYLVTKDTEKWVRYDADGHMVKGWDGENYFDPITGEMAKGIVRIDGKRYLFDEATGRNLGEAPAETRNILDKVIEYNSDGSSYVSEKYEYDSEGRMTKKIGYNPNGSICYESEYDRAGNQTKSIDYDSNGSIEGWTEYEYDSAGNCVKLIDKNAAGSIWRWYEYEYDSAGNETKEIEYRSDGSTNSRREFEYNSEGRLIRSTHYYYDGRSFCSELNDVGKVTGEIEYRSDGTISRRKEYGRNGKVTKEIDYYDGGSIEHEREYDSREKWTKEIGYYDGGSIESEREFDSVGNVTKDIRYNPDGSVDFGYEYEYDSWGNRTKYISYNANGSVSEQRELRNEYSSVGNKTKVICYDSDRICSEAEYDSAKNKIKLIEYRYFNDNIIKSIQEWDSAGNLTRYYIDCGIYSTYDNSYWYEYEYDSAGNLTRELNCDYVSGSPIFVYEYDSWGNTTKYIDNSFGGMRIFEYGRNGKVTKEIYYYDDGCIEEEIEHSLKKSISYYHDGSISGEREWDSKGKVTKENRYNPDGSIRSWLEFEYKTITVQ